MIEVLKQALEALERSVATCFDQYAHEQVMSQPEHFINQTITSLRQAIAEAEDNYQGSDAAKAAHMMDLYTALGVKWGEDPFAVIAKMREASTEESSATQEPVAWRSTSGTLCNLLNKGQIESGLWHPLYTHPQPKAEQEPFAWVYPEAFRRLNECGAATIYAKDGKGLYQDGVERIPLYAHPQPKQPLTDDEIWNNDDIMAANSAYGANFETLREVIRATEAAHGIKGEA